MSEQPRDEKGRFAKKEKKWGDGYKDIMLIIAIVILVGITGYSSYHDGYTTGLADNQSAIYTRGFTRGMMIADNQNDLAKEWKPCFLNMNPPKFVCSIKDKNAVAEIDGDYKVIKTWHFPEDTKKFLIEWVKL